MDDENNDLLPRHFSSAVAEHVGTNAAILLHNIVFWCQLNQVNENRNPPSLRPHQHEGVYWVYYSRRALLEQYPYLTESRVRTCLKKLVENGYVRKGRFNRMGYDKTTWYTPLIDYPLIVSLRAGQGLDEARQFIGAFPPTYTR